MVSLCIASQAATPTTTLSPFCSFVRSRISCRSSAASFDSLTMSPTACMHDDAYAERCSYTCSLWWLADYYKLHGHCRCLLKSSWSTALPLLDYYMHCVSTALPLILDPVVLISMPTGHIPLFDFSMFRAPRQPAFVHLMQKCHCIALKIDRWTEQPTCTASILSRDGKYQSITLQLVAIAKATTQMKGPIDDRGEKIYRALTLIAGVFWRIPYLPLYRWRRGVQHVRH